MRFSYAAIAALMAAAVSSQSVARLVSQLPSCALTCLATAAAGAHCGLSDYTCQCGLIKDVIIKSATSCITSSCADDDAIKVLTIINQICAVVGVGKSSTSSVAAPVGSFIPFGGSGTSVL